MKKIIILILILTLNKNYSQINDFLELNEKTVNSFLAENDFVLLQPILKNGFKIYSSKFIKNVEKSKITKKREIYFLNGYPVVFHNVTENIWRKELGNEKWDGAISEYYKSRFNENKNKYQTSVFSLQNKFEFLTNNFFLMDKSIFFKEYGYYTETDTQLKLIEQTIQELNFELYPLIKGHLYDSKEISILNIDTYNLEDMVKLFIDDLKCTIEYLYKNNLKNVDVTKKNIFFNNLKNVKIKAVFKEMDDDVLALSYGINNDQNILIEANPEKWALASNQKKWYIIYHELGHDILNFYHGEGGKMMYNFIDTKYSWGDFINDKKKMFEIYFKKNILKLNHNENEINYSEVFNLESPDGDKYEGNLLDGLKNGKGKILYSNGNSYDGDWLNGKKSGYGIYIYSEEINEIRKTYKGEWLNDQRSGYGEMTYTDGTVEKGYWENNYLKNKNYDKK